MRQVIANLGLCVSVYDIRSLEGGSIHPGEGCSIYKVMRALLLFISWGQILDILCLPYNILWKVNSGNTAILIHTL
jgi:DNA-directed RNA polymerase III subunit RPC8